MRRFLINLLGLLAFLVGTAVAAAPPGSPSNADSLAAMRALDLRVATIGYRLALANRDWCAEQAWLPGFVLHDLSQYGADYRQAAAQAFGLGEGPGVLALVADGPAARAAAAVAAPAR